MNGRMRPWAGMIVTAATVAVVGAAVLTGRTINGTASTPDKPSATTVAQIYVVALTGSSAPVHLANPIYIHDRVCPLVPDRPGVPCEGPPISTSIQAAVTRVLGTQAHFLAHPPAIGERGPTVYDIGELTVVGAHAEIDIQSQCGPLCGSGETLSLARAARRWTITDRTTHWIS